MSKGYLLFALDTKDTEYSKLAYACAMSIKLTQPEGYNKVTVVTNKPSVFKDKKKVFDKIVKYKDIATGMDARSRAYDYSPYDETVLLDADMLFLKPMDHYWDMMTNLDLYITSSPQSFNGNTFKYGYYRQLFVNNHWEDVYSAWTYFKKSESAERFFNVVKTITDNPIEFIKLTLPEKQVGTIPTDEAFAMALEILDISFPNWEFPRITHMKPKVQGWKYFNKEWIDALRFSMDEKGQVKLGVWQQSELLHYVNKDIINDSVINKLESAL
jgi:hypothetical protein